MKTVFFYGLFMDSEILREAQVVPRNARPAYAEDYELRIGQRATLIPCDGSRAYGMVMSLAGEDVDKLYAAPGLELYREETIDVTLMSGGALSVSCYNLTDAPAPDEANPEYATRLRDVLSKLEFPTDYIASVS